MARSLVLRLRRSLRGGGSCPGAGRDSVQPRQTDAVDQIAAREADGCKAEGRGLLESESFMSMNRMRNRVSGSPLAASQLRQTDEVDQFLGLSRLHPTLLSPGPPRAGRNAPAIDGDDMVPVSVMRTENARRSPRQDGLSIIGL